MDKGVLLVIPVYNEDKAVKKVILEWIGALSSLGADYKILALDDGSLDKSGAVLDSLSKEYSQLGVIHKLNEGHGKTILRGYALAIKENYEWVFQTDSDGQFFAKDFISLWNLREKADFILGYRFQRKDPLGRLAITRILKYTIFVLWGILIRDANSPFRLMRAHLLSECLKDIPEDAFAPNIFLSILAFKRAKGNFLQVKVRHKIRESGESSIVRLKLFKSVIRSFYELVKFRVK